VPLLIFGGDKSFVHVPTFVWLGGKSSTMEAHTQSKVMIGTRIREYGMLAGLPTLSPVMKDDRAAGGLAIY